MALQPDQDEEDQAGQVEGEPLVVPGAAKKEPGSFTTISDYFEDILEMVGIGSARRAFVTSL